MEPSLERPFLLAPAVSLARAAREIEVPPEALDRGHLDREAWP